MGSDLTKRQKQFLEFICDFIEQHGYPPSIRETQKAFGLKSTKGVKDHIDRLVEKGYLNRENGSARALSISNASRERLVNFTAPIIGRVAAGSPILAEENEDGTLPVPERFRGVQGLFWLKVRGDSMIEEGIHHGDMVLVKPAPFVDQGTVAVIMVENEATVKKFYRYGDTIRLAAANPDFADMEFFGRQCSELRLVGKVVAVFRFLA
ncbi:MAG TPA: transcriptional repressor LexA [Candidatus Sabulitectum sp.]|nr:transcriptional repressor LexA [Candidatus Sabulitectum sp.]HPF31928.1 transcriptional repressor LexA [Candidatus Sabulitectum sp.]HPJ29429.1 transcriptional repressor LexA [Candidatus Sabulitectum sp.]HPR23200.1 transcriptional repressor LexA [Candidatus Sabulitectum sp.]HRW77437.1 transcriptional repressor LexA [Candidatus Sabulitectum sp.]